MLHLVWHLPWRIVTVFCAWTFSRMRCRRDFRLHASRPNAVYRDVGYCWMLLEVLVRFWYFLTLQVYLSFVYAILTLCAWILEKAGWAAHRRADCRTQSVDKAGPSLSSQQPAISRNSKIPQACYSITIFLHQLNLRYCSNLVTCTL